MMLTEAALKKLLHYDPETGIFTRLVTCCNRALVGNAAGWRNSSGHFQIHIKGKHYYTHRLAWLYMTGDWPADQIDHINGHRADNRWSNLREATRAVNLQNQHKARRDNIVGLLGVSLRRKKFSARIEVDGRKRNLGTFNTAELAHCAYLKAKRILHPGCTI